MNTIILNYGCPRTGTTFINEMLSCGRDIVTGKIAEGHSYHPIRSNNGLLNLSYTFQKNNLVFIRTIRDPISIFKSFYHIRTDNECTLAKVEDESIKEMIKLEEINTTIQYDKINLITINFDKMKEYSYISKKISEISEYTKDPQVYRKIYLDFIEEKYDKKPVRKGNLSDKASQINYLSKEKEEEIINWYREFKNSTNLNYNTETKL